MSRFAVTAASDAVQLSNRAGEASFTVGNTGTDPDRVMAVVIVNATDTPAAKQEWFTVDDPLRTIDPNGHDQYRVAVAVPADVAAGTYGFRLRAYSADLSPEETGESSKRVTFTIEPPVVAPGKPWYKQWWLYVVVAVIVALLVAVFLILRKDDAKVTAATFTAPKEVVRCKAACPVEIAWTDTGADSYRIEVRDVTNDGNSVALGATSVTDNRIVIVLNNGREYQATVTTVDGGKNLAPTDTRDFTVSFAIIVDPPPTFTSAFEAQPIASP